MLRSRQFLIGAALACSLLALPALGWAQSEIGGRVVDASAAVLPGVTVEVTSPALIERSRVATTDTSGRYLIPDLRPGTYTVAFSLPGFTRVIREGITLSTGFSATVNVEMQIGAIAESVTVQGSSPLVDVQSVRQQRVVTDEVMRTLPSATLTTSNLGAIVPGMAGTINVGGASGTIAMMSVSSIRYHGKGGAKAEVDGMRINNVDGASFTGYLFNPALMEEWSLETGAAPAESAVSGVSVNLIPRVGGNSYSGSASSVFTNDALQGSNLTDELRARGLERNNEVQYIFNQDATIGGPILVDRLWFFAAERIAANKNTVAGLFFNRTQGSPFYTADTSRPAYRNELLQQYGGRLTWQAATRHKFNILADFQSNCVCRGRGEFVAPEAQYHWQFSPQGITQGTWTFPASQRLLFEAGAGLTLSNRDTMPQAVVRPIDISITDLSTGLLYNAGSYGEGAKTVRTMQRVSVSYVTGSHAYKIGAQIDEGTLDGGVSYHNGSVAYQLRTGADGVAMPSSITEYAEPLRIAAKLDVDLALYAQDRWAWKRLTLNYGLRFEYFRASVPAQSVGAGMFTPSREFEAVQDVPEWSDLNPRFGAAFDLTGDSKTAVKVAIGRYTTPQATELARANNPLNTSINSVSRVWADADGDYVPDCDLTNPLANGECLAISNQNFGKANINATRYDERLLRGFGVRNYLWDASVEIQRELRPGLSVSGGYFRNWYGNFSVTDNLEVTSADFDPYCITAPVDTRLPGGGGYEVCGLYDVSLDKFGKVNTFVTRAANFGKQRQVSDFLNVTVNARAGGGLQLGGGIDFGRTAVESCFIVDSPQELLNCDKPRSQPLGTSAPSLSVEGQAKVWGSYSLPAGFTISGSLQNTGGPEIQANYQAPNAAIAPSLGRNLAACGTRAVCTATALVPLIEPQTLFEGRRTQLDLRLGKQLSVGRARLEVNLASYNVLNANPINGIVTTYGSRWLEPVSNAYTGGAVLDARMFQLGGRLTF